jgi:signal peptidase I
VTILRRHRVRLLAAAACLLLALLSFEIALVPTGSMERTVLVGDNILVFKLLDAPRIPGTSLRLPRFRSPRRGALVSFLAPGRKGSVYLKRVVGTAGDVVEFRAGRLYVNGVRANESYAPRSTRIPEFGPQRLRRGELFVLGDNRDLSEDSRDFGPISTDSVVGTPLAVVWSTRARTPDLLDAGGHVRLAFYWSALLHPVASTRWSRIGRLL